MDKAIERRKQQRYQLGEWATAFAADSAGHIQNISMGGISFVYMDLSNLPKNGDTVDIIDSTYDFFMEGIPCRVVTRRLIHNKSPFNIIRMLQCSMEFGALTESQEADLKAYINSNGKA